MDDTSHLRLPARTLVVGLWFWLLSWLLQGWLLADGLFWVGVAFGVVFLGMAVHRVFGGDWEYRNSPGFLWHVALRTVEGLLGVCLQVWLVWYFWDWLLWFWVWFYVALAGLFLLLGVVQLLRLAFGMQEPRDRPAK